jgi:hypothetical protein
VLSRLFTSSSAEASRSASPRPISSEVDPADCANRNPFWAPSALEVGCANEHRYRLHPLCPPAKVLYRMLGPSWLGWHKHDSGSGGARLGMTDARDIDTSNSPVVEFKGIAVDESAPRRRRIDQQHPRYKWVALSNTTLGALLASINASIVLISLPAVFRGIGLNPLAPGNVSYLLWMLMGYLMLPSDLGSPQ